MIRLTLYSRPGCHLCDDMKAMIARVAQSIPLTLDDVDIYDDDELEERYGLEIPVLLVEGERVASVRMTEDALVRILTSRAP